MNHKSKIEEKLKPPITPTAIGYQILSVDSYNTKGNNPTTVVKVVNIIGRIRLEEAIII